VSSRLLGRMEHRCAIRARTVGKAEFSRHGENTTADSGDQSSSIRESATQDVLYADRRVVAVTKDSASITGDKTAHIAAANDVRKQAGGHTELYTGSTSPTGSGSGCVSKCTSVSTAWLPDIWPSSADLSPTSTVTGICDLLAVAS